MGEAGLFVEFSRRAEEREMDKDGDFMGGRFQLESDERVLGRMPGLCFRPAVALLGIVLVLQSCSGRREPEIRSLVDAMRANDSRLKSVRGEFLVKIDSEKMTARMPNSGSYAARRTERLVMYAEFPKIRVEQEIFEGHGVSGALLKPWVAHIWTGEREYVVNPSVSGRVLVFDPSDAVGPSGWMIPLLQALFLFETPRADALQSGVDFPPLSGKVQARWVGSEVIDGVTAGVMDMTLKMPEARYDKRYWSDRNRGALPLRMEDTSVPGGTMSRWVFSDFKEYDGLWLPLTARLEWIESDGSLLLAANVETVFLEVNRPVPEHVFQPPLIPRGGF